jgi:hypothetical protein
MKNEEQQSLSPTDAQMQRDSIEGKAKGKSWVGRLMMVRYTIFRSKLAILSLLLHLAGLAGSVE